MVNVQLYFLISTFFFGKTLYKCRSHESKPYYRQLHLTKIRLHLSWSFVILVFPLTNPSHTHNFFYYVKRCNNSKRLKLSHSFPTVSLPSSSPTFPLWKHWRNVLLLKSKINIFYINDLPPRWRQRETNPRNPRAN